MSQPSAIPASGLGVEAVGVLQRLIRFDTTNPPGNEAEAQAYLRSLLEPVGFECSLLEQVPNRPNLVARLRGSGDGPTVCLLGHVDTVKADPDEWSHDPWSGELADGWIWGRGALDMKGQVAAEVAAAAHLARLGWRPGAGDLLLVVTVDEETGGEHGARWLCAENADAVRCDVVINEGGGGLLEFDGRRYHTLCVGEKGVRRFRLVTSGEAAHAALPRMGDNALTRLAPLLERLSSRQPGPDPPPVAGPMLSILLDDPGLADLDPHAAAVALERVRAVSPHLADALIEPILGVTLVPTKASASEKANVIPSRAEVLVDCRVPPGIDPASVEARVREVLGAEGYELEWVEEVETSASPFSGPAVDAIRGWVAETDPDARLLPVLLPGFSDSHWFRSELGAEAYGFFPHREVDVLGVAPLIHAADERVPAADIELAASCYAGLARSLLGGEVPA